jgi:hypothetical protein
MTRLIDADELKKCAIPCEIHNGASTDLCVPLYQIDNAPTVEPHYLSDLPDETIKSLQTVAIDVSDGFVVFERKRPQGEWGKWIISEIRCPYCLEYYDPDCYSKEELNKCPNCGASMVGG